MLYASGFTFKERPIPVTKKSSFTFEDLISAPRAICSVLKRPVSIAADADVRPDREISDTGAITEKARLSLNKTLPLTCGFQMPFPRATRYRATGLGPLDAMWQLVRILFWLAGGPWPGRAPGVGEVKFPARFRETAKQARYHIHIEAGHHA